MTGYNFCRHIYIKILSKIVRNLSCILPQNSTFQVNEGLNTLHVLETSSVNQSNETREKGRWNSGAQWLLRCFTQVAILCCKFLLLLVKCTSLQRMNRLKHQQTLETVPTQQTENIDTFLKVILPPQVLQQRQNLKFVKNFQKVCHMTFWRFLTNLK